MVVAGVWLAIHVASFQSGIDGLWVSNALVVGSASNAAALLARTVRSPGSLVALAVTASLVDVASFTGGPTRFLPDSGSESISEALRYLAITIFVDGHPVAVVGVGDLLIFGVLSLALRMQGHSRRRPWAVLTAALRVALLVGLFWGGAFGIPFMAIGAIALTLRSRPAGARRR